MKRFAILLCILLLLSICVRSSPSNLPDVQSINNLYYRNKEDIDTVVNFMVNAEYDSILISNSEGTPSMSADFHIVDISDQNVLKAVKYLIDNDIVLHFYKSDGDIELLLWGKRGVRYYIACSFENSVPSVQYATEVFPMDEENWYYVIADSNVWRAEDRGRFSVLTRKTGDGSLS